MYFPVGGSRALKITRMAADTPRSRSLREAAGAGVPAALADLGALVRIPSVAFEGFADDPVRASAEAVADLARGTGIFDSVDVRQAAITDTQRLGKPAVLARRAARNGRPTVLLYAHHDVQPTGDESDWQSPPFEPTVRDGRLYARGAADDKAGVMVHIGAVRALAEVTGDDLDVGVVLFVEGEEEAGSRSFGQFLADNTEDLRSDVIVVADSGNWDERTPALTVSLRGNVRLTLRIRTLAHASHSGMFGGAVPDAMMAAVTVLASLWDDSGAVAVPGLTERDAETPDYDEDRLRAETGLIDGVRPIGRGSILSRIWNKPAITITGIDAPDIAGASNTLTPEVAVVISARVAPGQDARTAGAAIEEHLRANAPFGARLEFSDWDFGDPFLVDVDGWAVEDARASLEEGYGTRAVDLGVGGSIPFIADLVREFPSAQILVTGVEDPHTRAHSPNESLHLETFRNALTAEALLLGRLNDRRNEY